MRENLNRFSYATNLFFYLFLCVLFLVFSVHLASKVDQMPRRHEVNILEGKCLLLIIKCIILHEEQCYIYHASETGTGLLTFLQDGFSRKGETMPQVM